MNKLLPYQVEGAAWLANSRAALLADEMGLGKTVQAIEAVNLLGETANHVLVVCPASLKLNWAREWAKWTRQKLTVGVAKGGAWPDSQVVIINYDILERHRKRMNSTIWDVAIFDEAQYLKNPKAKRSRMILGGWGALPLSATHKYALTGTPILNRPIEVHAILQYLQPGQWMSRQTFGMKFCDAKLNPWSGSWDFNGASAIDELQRMLKASGVMLRRRKADVLKDLPPKRRQIIPLEPGVKGEAAIRAEKKLMLGNSWRESISKLVWEKEWFEHISLLRHEVARSKIPDVVGFLESLIEDTGKVVCFAHHKDVIDEIHKAFKENSVTLTGETPNTKRQEAVDRFQTDPKVNLFIGNIQAAGVGITLTAASNVVFAELDWVPGVMTQAEDRLHRIGQTAQSVNVYHLVLDGSLDAEMAQRIIEKQAVIDLALGEVDAEELAKLMS